MSRHGISRCTLHRFSERCYNIIKRVHWWLRTDIPDPRRKHSNKRTPAVLVNGPAYPLDTHTQPPHKRPCTSQHICATPEPQSNTVPDAHTTDPSNDAEANGDSSLRRVS